jgi:hypothetical protein
LGGRQLVFQSAGLGERVRGGVVDDVVDEVLGVGVGVVGGGRGGAEGEHFRGDFRVAEFCLGF